MSVAVQLEADWTGNGKGEGRLGRGVRGGSRRMLDMEQEVGESWKEPGYLGGGGTK